MKALVKTVFEKASSKDEEPDLRDRAYIYWRMLKNDPSQVQAVVLSEKPPVVADTIMHLSQGGLQLMIDRIGHLSSIIYDIEVEEYTERQQIRKKLEEEGDQEDDDQIQNDHGQFKEGSKSPSPQKTKQQNSKNKPNSSASEAFKKKTAAKKKGDLQKNKDDVLQDEKVQQKKSETNKKQEPMKPLEALNNVMNLLQLDYDEPVSSSTTTTATSSNNLFPFLGGSDFGLSAFSSVVQQFSQPQFSMVLQPYTPGSMNQNTGFSIQANFIRKDSKLLIHAIFGNNSQSPLTDFQIQLNVNAFGIATVSQNVPLVSLGPFQKQEVDIICCIKQQSKNNQPLTNPQSIQCAVKNSLDVFYFQVPVFIHALFDPLNQMSVSQFDSFAQKLGVDISMKGGKFQVGGNISEQASKKLKANGFFLVQQQSGPGSLSKYGTKIQTNGSPVLIVLKQNSAIGGVQLSAKVESQGIAELLKNSLRLILGVQS